MIADVMTKAFHNVRFEKRRGLLFLLDNQMPRKGMLDMSSESGSDWKRLENIPKNYYL